MNFKEFKITVDGKGMHHVFLDGKEVNPILLSLRIDREDGVLEINTELPIDKYHYVHKLT